MSNPFNSKHVIEIYEINKDRSGWDCDCGASGSASTWDVDVAAEKHVKPGESVSYRHVVGGL